MASSSPSRVLGNYAGDIGRECLKIQHSLASQVLRELHAPRVYVFDSSMRFAGAETIFVNGIRVLLSANGEFALLSQAAQRVLNSHDAAHVYTQIANMPSRLIDNIGVYIET